MTFDIGRTDYRFAILQGLAYDLILMTAGFLPFLFVRKEQNR